MSIIELIEKYQKNIVILLREDDSHYVVMNTNMTFEDVPTRFKYTELDTVLPTLINKYHLRVAICEQLRDEDKQRINEKLKAI